MLKSQNLIIIGVVADTHIPDRRGELDVRILQIFKEAGVMAIMHAGDVSTPAVLHKLEEIAPVFAVRGNRDWVALRHLPVHSEFTFGTIKVGLTHGHGPLWDYVIDRLDYMVRVYRLDLFRSRLLDTFPKANVIVFGHTHRSLNLWTDGKLLFNPGSPHFPDQKYLAPSVGLLTISAEGGIVGEIIELKNR